MDDQELLRRYVESGSEGAFAKIVERHRDWVYSVCVRRLGDPHGAEDAAQAVFMALAQKARALAKRESITGWLYQAANFAAADARKMARRRAQREAEAADMHAQRLADTEETWERLVLQLEPAMDRLSAKERVILLQRYYEKETHQEIARRLGVSEEAAKKRVARAIESLRAILSKKGVIVPGVVLGKMLLEGTVQAAPATLSAAGCGIAGESSSWVISQGVLRMMFWMRMKVAVPAGVLACALVAGGVLGSRMWGQGREDVAVAATGPSAPTLSIAPSPLANVAVTPPKVGTISGKVIDPDGKPAAKIRVKSRVGTYMQLALTNDAGEFLLKDVPVGATIVSAWNWDDASLLEGTARDGHKVDDFALLRAVSPDAAKLDTPADGKLPLIGIASKRIEVTADQNTSLPDPIQLAPTIKVTGKVLATNGQPAANIHVRFSIPLAADTWVLTGTEIATNERGEYAFKGVPVSPGTKIQAFELLELRGVRGERPLIVPKDQGPGAEFRFEEIQLGPRPDAPQSGRRVSS